MKKVKLILAGILLMVLNYSFSQSETKSFTYENYNSKSLKFIEYTKTSDGFKDLKNWFEGKVNDELIKKLGDLNEFINTNSPGMKINIIPYSKIPKKNNPLVIYYLLVDKEEKNQFGLFIGFLDDGNKIIDDIKTLKWSSKEGKQKANMDSTATSLPPLPSLPPPTIIKNE